MVDNRLDLGLSSYNFVLLKNLRAINMRAENADQSAMASVLKHMSVCMCACTHTHTERERERLKTEKILKNPERSHQKEGCKSNNVNSE